ncbi:MAG: hypothetical protein Q9221_003487 [Calogaya cf. arnoldii]
MAVNMYPTGSKRPWDLDSVSVKPEQPLPTVNDYELRLDLDGIKDCIKNCLDGISSVADEAWAFGGLLEDAPNPGLTLKGSGIVGLPLSPEDANRLRKESALHTPSTSDSCLLKPKSFELRNPAWNRFMEKLVARLLSETRLATISLVDLRLQSHSEAIQSDLFSDVHQASQSLVTGARLQLNYCVYSRGPEPLETATTMTSYAQDFEDELARWKRLPRGTEEPRLLAYVLEDHYNDKSLDFSSLTEADVVKAKWLRERCERQGVIPLLSRLLGNVSYTSHETTMELEDFVDFDGNHVLDAVLDFAPEDVVQNDIYRGRDYNDPEFDPGSELEEESYVDWAFVLLPKEDLTAFLFSNRSDENIRSWMQRLTDDVRYKSHPDSTRHELAYIVSQYTKSLERQSLPKNPYGDSGHPADHEAYFRQGLAMLIRASILLKDKDLFASSVSKCPASVPGYILQEIREAINSHTIEVFSPGLERTLQKVDLLTWDRIMQALQFGAESEHPLYIQDVYMKLIRSGPELALQTSAEYSPEDIPVLLDMAERYGDLFFVQRVLPVVTAQSDDLGFAMTFLEELTSRQNLNWIDYDIASIAGQSVIRAVTPLFEKHTWEPIPKRQKLNREGFSCPEGQDMARIIRLCVDSGYINDFNHLFLAIADNIPKSDSRWLQHILMPFLEELCTIIHQYGLSVASWQVLLQLFQDGFTHIVSRYIGQAPASPSHWALRLRGCGCKDCREHLDPFLNSPHRKLLDYTSTQKKRDHLEGMVSGDSSIRASTRHNHSAPHTLLLEKTRDGYDQSVKAWQDRFREVRAKIGRMDRKYLKELLGGRYQKLTGLNMEGKMNPVPASEQPTRQPLAEA